MYVYVCMYTYLYRGVGMWVCMGARGCAYVCMYIHTYYAYTCIGPIMYACIGLYICMHVGPVHACMYA